MSIKQTENKQRKGDFTPRYYNAQAIIENEELQPAEQVCELVKHYSMCLFGIATDISDYYGKLAERDSQIAMLKKEVIRLRQRNTRLSLQITTQDKEPQQVIDELAKLKLDNTHLKMTLNSYKAKCEKLQGDTAIVELQNEIDRQRQQRMYWQERAEQLEALNKALTERKNNGT